MDDYAQPVVSTRPLRGREIQSKIVPTDILDTRNDGNLALEQKKQKDKTGEVYHEGYVDGKLYMVPDSNLEAMKDIINFHMRPRRSTRYKHQTSHEISDYDHFRGKLSQLLDKIENIQPIFSLSGSASEKSDDKKQSSISSNGTISTMSTSSTSEVSLDEEDIYHDKNTVTDKNIEPEKELEELQEPFMSEPMEPNIKQIPEPEADEYRLRFLISGHIINDQKPVYIIQQYEGETNIFEGQKTDFSSYTEENNHNVLISGKFYNENILEESQGKPVALNLQPKKILINEETSKVYDNGFTNTFRFEDFDVLLKGEFIKTERTKNITPLLTLGITHKTSEKSKSGTQEENNDPDNSYMFKNQSTINVFNYSSKGRTAFSSSKIPDNSFSDNSKSFSDHSQKPSIEKNSHFQTYNSTTESSQSDSSSQSTSLDEEPTVYKYPQSHDLENFREEKNVSRTKEPIKRKNSSKYLNNNDLNKQKDIINTAETGNIQIGKLVENYKNKEVENNKNYNNSQAIKSKHDNSKQIVKATPLKKGSIFQIIKVNSFFKLFAKKNIHANPEQNPTKLQKLGKQELKLSKKQPILSFNNKMKENHFEKCVKQQPERQTLDPKGEKRHVKPNRYLKRETCKHSTGHESQQSKIIVEHPHTNKEETFPTEIRQYEDKDIKSTQFITYI